MCCVLFFYSTIVSLPGNHVKYTWSVDTSVDLFWSQIFNTVCHLPYTFYYTIAIQYPSVHRELLCFKYINKFKLLLGIYCGPYKVKYHSWTSLMLLMRTIFFGLSAFDRWMNLSGGTILLGMLLYIQGIVHPFRYKFSSIQESFILLDLLCIIIICSSKLQQ